MSVNAAADIIEVGRRMVVTSEFDIVWAANGDKEKQALLLSLALDYPHARIRVVQSDPAWVASIRSPTPNGSVVQWKDGVLSFEGEVA
jgi:hypothetical protein